MPPSSPRKRNHESVTAAWFSGLLALAMVQVAEAASVGYEGGFGDSTFEEAMAWRYGQAEAEIGCYLNDVGVATACADQTGCDEHDTTCSATETSKYSCKTPAAGYHLENIDVAVPTTTTTTNTTTNATAFATCQMHTGGCCWDCSSCSWKGQNAQY
eukprot:gene27691-6476_t